MRENNILPESHLMIAVKRHKSSMPARQIPGIRSGLASIAHLAANIQKPELIPRALRSSIRWKRLDR